MKKNKDPVHLVVKVYFFDRFNLRHHTMKFYHCRKSEAIYVASVYAKIMFWSVELVVTFD